MAENQGGVSHELPDDRLRAVEVGLAVLTGKVEEVRSDVKEGFASMGLEGRLKSCPHNEDFVRVLAALEAGGKRFDALALALSDAVENREEHFVKVEDRIGRVEGRVKVLEDDWKSAKTSVKTAKWVVGFFGLMVGWIFNELLPLLEKLLNVSK